MCLRGFLVAAVFFNAPPAHACRCAQQTLDAYAANAEIVFFGRVTSIEHKARNGGHRAVRFAVDGSPFKGVIEGLAFATPASFASCGVPVQTGERYLIFANRQSPNEPVAWFDTCNGTRSFDAQAPGGVQGFIDAEPADVLERLAALRKAAAGSPPTMHAPRPPRACHGGWIPAYTPAGKLVTWFHSRGC